MTFSRCILVNVLSLETNTVQRLEKLLNDGQTGSDWTELASRLRLQSLVDTYKNTPSPTENLLRSYEVDGLFSRAIWYTV